LNYSEINRAKIPKVVYLLLQKYHRIYGLGVIGWFKQPGSHYFSFFSQAVYEGRGRPKHLPELWGRYKLTLYQDHLGMPARGNDSVQAQHPHLHDRELRSKDMVQWIEEHLTLPQFFRDYSAEIDRWRRKCTVEQSERYLLTWNVMGLYAKAKKGMIYVAGSDPNYGMSDQKRKAASALGIQNPQIDLHVCRSLVFGSNAKVYLPDGNVVDFWEDYKKFPDVKKLMIHLQRM